jgi:hypothetical protein
MKRTFPFVTGDLYAGLSSSEDDSDDSPSFFPFVPVSCRAYIHIYEKEV